MLPSDWAAAWRTSGLGSLRAATNAGTTAPVVSERFPRPGPAIATIGTRALSRPGASAAVGTRGSIGVRAGRGFGSCPSSAILGTTAIAVRVNNTPAAATIRRRGLIDIALSSINRWTRLTNWERSSAIPASGIGRGAASIHSATVTKHFAIVSPPPIRSAAHSSHRNSASA